MLLQENVSECTLPDMAKQGRKPSGKVLLTCRVNADNLVKLDDLGANAKPVPASRSEMVDVAVAEYVARNWKKSKER